MKKRSIIFYTALTLLSILVFGFINLSDSETNQEKASSIKIVAEEKQVIEGPKDKAPSDFFYDIGTRFRGIKKVELDNAKSIIDFLPNETSQEIANFKSVSVIILDDYRQTEMRETGNSDVLTVAQSKLLRSADYSTNILIRADFQERNKNTGKLHNNYFTPYLTIVPETQAEYVNGKKSLINYLKENSKEEINIVIKDQLKAGKLYFTVTKEGTILNADIRATSGYPTIDKKMIELITNMPGKWKPAKNSEDKNVEQILVFSFGIIGC